MTIPREDAVEVVPFVDLKAQYRAIRGEIGQAFEEVFEQAAFVDSPFVARFEEAFAAYCGTRHAVAVGNGTCALWLALLGLGVGAGDEVITVPNTFVATIEAIRLCGAKPVFVDVEETSYNLDHRLVEAAITSRTKAILPVHLFGHTCDLDPILELAQSRGLVVVEDASQAHGALYKGGRAGSLGTAGCFSFYPSKNLGAYGEAGAVVTNDDELAARLRLLRNHGSRKKYSHVMFGWNARMDGLQGAALRVKLDHLEAWNEARRRNARSYGERLRDVRDVVLPVEAPYARHVYHIYAVRIPRRDEVKSELEAKGIVCGLHYPRPLHLQEGYADLGYREGAFPVAEECARTFLSLPMFAELSEEQISRVGTELKGSLGARSDG
jgi:dTDP-4-amino-4,6-dideoxygalactose transaminase